MKNGWQTIVFFTIVLWAVGLPNTLILGQDYDLTDKESILEDLYKNRNLDAKQYLEKISRLKRVASLEGNEKYLCIAHREEGFYRYINGNFEAALAELSKAISIAEGIDDDHLILSCYKFQALVYLESHEYFLALDIYQRILNICQQKNDINTILETNQMIGETYKRCKFYDLALEYFHKSNPDLHTDPGWEERHGWWNLNLGEVYFLNDNFSQALIHYQKAMTVWDSLDMVRGKGFTYNCLGDLHLKQGSKKCLMYYEKAMIANTKLENWNEILRSKIGIAKYLESTMQDTVVVAESYADIVNNIRGNEYNAHLLDAIDYFVDHPNQRNQLSTSFETVLLKRAEINRELRQKMKFKEFKIIEIMNKLQVIENEKDHIEDKLVSIKTTTLGIVLIMLVLAAIFARIIYLNWNLRKKSSKLKVQKENMTKIIDDIQSSQSIMKEDLRDLKKFSEVQQIKLIHSQNIISSIREKIKSDDNLSRKLEASVELGQDFWKEITELNQVQDNHIMKKLHEKFPQLTNKELQLCCMFSIGLSNKEVALICQKSYESVKVFKARIKKKTNCEGRNLAQHINNLVQD